MSGSEWGAVIGAQICLVALVVLVVMIVRLDRTTREVRDRGLGVPARVGRCAA